MGYELDRFLGYVNEGLLCCVCGDVLERPLQAPCEHAYCGSCINRWLLHHSTCPEDRQPLEPSRLKPLYRYMRNDLNRLQIRCANARQGCEAVCSLEGLPAHEDHCQYAYVSCTNSGCLLQVERRDLEAHLSECGSTTSPNQRSQHNGLLELQSEIETLRYEMLTEVQNVRLMMESQQNSERRYLAQNERQLKAAVDELKGQLFTLTCDIRTLSAEVSLSRRFARAHLDAAKLPHLLTDPVQTLSVGDQTDGSLPTKEQLGKRLDKLLIRIDKVETSLRTLISDKASDTCFGHNLSTKYLGGAAHTV
ncbi:uncharacterized protein rnf41l isoform 2-T6 [Synchiropus picturatus]